MIGTNRANTDPVRATSRARRPVQGLLLLALVLGVVCFGTLWMSLGAWRQLQSLEATFKEAQPNRFLLGIHLREGTERLTATLLLFSLSGDPEARERFQSVSGELQERLEQLTPRLQTSHERALAEKAGEQLRQFVDASKPRLVKGLKGIRKDTAEQVHSEISALSAPLLLLGSELVQAQERAADAFFQDSRLSLKTLRLWLLVSCLLLGALMSVIGLVVHRTWISPLQERLDATEAVIVQQERLVSLGTIAAGVAHEIRNPLTAIQFRLFSLRKALPTEFAQQEDLVIIQSEIQRLERLVKGFLSFARPAEPVLAPVTARSLIDDVAALLRTELQRRGLTLDIGRIPEVSMHADRQQLQQVLINLILNAADVSPKHAHIRITVEASAFMRQSQSIPAVHMQVSDSGPGIPKEVAAQMFDPFFSTKEGGTGLGLPIASRIAEKHGGYIQFQPDPAGGSVFSLILPKLPSPPNP